MPARWPCTGATGAAVSRLQDEHDEALALAAAATVRVTIAAAEWDEALARLAATSVALRTERASSKTPGQS